jgi:hypothetical protein
VARGYARTMGPLRREVMVPVPSYRRPSSLIGMSIVLVLLASAVDAVVWTYQARREVERGNLDDATGIPRLNQTDVAALRARVLETDLARAEEELRQVDEQMLERLQGETDSAQVPDEDEAGMPIVDRIAPDRLDDRVVTHPRCDPSDPLCDGE